MASDPLGDIGAALLEFGKQAGATAVSIFKSEAEADAARKVAEAEAAKTAQEATLLAQQTQLAKTQAAGANANLALKIGGGVAAGLIAITAAVLLLRKPRRA